MPWSRRCRPVFDSIQKFRSKLDSGKFCLGTGITLSDPVVTEALGPHSDFFWIDLEHTPLNLESLQAHLIASRAVAVPALVRVPGSEVAFIKRVLDSGAAGLIVPQVRCAEEVRKVVQACRYKPLGDRGYGPRRASAYGASGATYLETANKQLFVSVQIENTDALKALDEILTVPGLDSIVVGPYDLSASMGLIGQVTHPEVAGAISTIITKARKTGLYVGMGGDADCAFALRAARAGVQWLQCGSDFRYLINCVQALFADIRRQLEA